MGHIEGTVDDFDGQTVSGSGPVSFRHSGKGNNGRDLNFAVRYKITLRNGGKSKLDTCKAEVPDCTEQGIGCPQGVAGMFKIGGADACTHKDKPP